MYMLVYGAYIIYTMQFLREFLFLSLIYRLLTFVKTIQANNERQCKIIQRVWLLLIGDGDYKTIN